MKRTQYNQSCPSATTQQSLLSLGDFLRIVQILFQHLRFWRERLNTARLGCAYFAACPRKEESDLNLYSKFPCDSNLNTKEVCFSN